MSNDEKNLSTGTILMSFVAGTAVGAGLALLYAPKSGREMRDTISDLTEDAVDKIKEYAKEAQEKIKTVIDDSRETFVEKKSILSSAIDAGKEAMQKEKDRIVNP